MQEPLLQYPNYEKEFIVVTDASKRGLGAVLLQQDDNRVESFASFASRTLTVSEKNYMITELKALGIMFALKKFKNMIYRYLVKVCMDHTAAVRIFEKKEYPSSRLAHWSLIINDFHPVFKYIKEKRNYVADYLSWWWWRSRIKWKHRLLCLTGSNAKRKESTCKGESKWNGKNSAFTRIKNNKPSTEILYETEGMLCPLSQGKGVTRLRMFRGMIFI